MARTPGEKRTEPKKIRFCPTDLQRVVDAHRAWAKGKTADDAEWDLFILELIDRPPVPVATSVSAFQALDAGREPGRSRR